MALYGALWMSLWLMCYSNKILSSLTWKLFENLITITKQCHNYSPLSYCAIPSTVFRQLPTAKITHAALKDNLKPPARLTKPPRTEPKQDGYILIHGILAPPPCCEFDLVETIFYFPPGCKCYQSEARRWAISPNGNARVDVQCVRERPWGPIAANGYLIEWVKRGDAVKKGDRPVGLFVIWSTPAHRCAKRGSRMLISRSCVYVCVCGSPLHAFQPVDLMKAAYSVMRCGQIAEEVITRARSSSCGLRMTLSISQMRQHDRDAKSEKGEKSTP